VAAPAARAGAARARKADTAAAAPSAAAALRPANDHESLQTVEIASGSV
jgi:hypothetical protein